MLMRILLIFSSILGLLSSSSPMNPLTPRSQPKVYAAEEPQDFEIEFFPVAPFHVGDVISARVTYTGPGEIRGKEIQISLSDQPGVILSTTRFSQYGNQANLYWILDTSSYQSGFIEFTFDIPELERSWQKGIYLLPPIKVAEPEWASIDMQWGKVYYIEGTDAAQDIFQIEETIEETANHALNQFFPAGIPDDNPLEGKIDLVLVPAIIGHGGFATDFAVVTYTDRNWVGSSFETITHHEMVHVMDRELNNEGPRPPILSEGIAVYLSGGHYREGDPLLRASALLELGEYIPLEELADEFYNAQHEIAYMEGAALVAYMTEMWGWEEFLEFYFHLEEAGTSSATLSEALEGKTGKDLWQFENDFTTYLNSFEIDDKVLSDVALTIEVYDTIRRYQTAVIPSAHYRTAWWPPIDKMLEMGMTGDYNNREKAPLNILIENYLIEIQQAFPTHNYKQIENHLDTIDKYLDTIENSEGNPSHYNLGWPLPHSFYIHTYP